MCLEAEVQGGTPHLPCQVCVAHLLTDTKAKSSVSILALGSERTINIISKPSEHVRLCYPPLEIDSSAMGRYGLERDTARGQADAATASILEILGNMVFDVDCYS
jgi:hypothetical protein